MYPPKLIRTIFIFILITLLYSESLSANLDMQVSSAYDNYHKQYKWLTLYLVLTNNVGEFNGDVVVETQSYNSKDSCTYSTPVSLFGNAKKTKYLYVYPESAQSSITVKLKDEQGISVIEKALHLDIISPEERLVAIVDENKQANLIPSGGKIHFAKISPEKLPDEWQGYDPIDSFFIGNFSPDLLSDKQRQALIRWLYCGGTVVVSGGVNAQSLKDTFIGNFLPVEVGGTRAVNAISSLGISGTPMVVSASSLRDGGKIILAEDDGMPVIAEKKVGSGKCVFVCFDYSDPRFHSRLVSRNFWDKIAPKPTKTDDVKYNNISRMIANQSHLGLPSHKFIGGFWLLYVLFLAIPGYIIIKKSRKKWLVWLFASLIIIVFVLSSLVFSYTISKKSLVISDFSIVEIYQDAQFARLESYFSPLSFIKSGFEVNFPEAIFVEKPISADGGAYWKGSTKLGQSDDYRLDISKTRFLSSQFLYGESVVNFGGKILFDVDKANPKVKNNIQFDLEDCLLVMGGRYSKIKTLGGNSEVNIEPTNEYSGNFLDNYNVEDSERERFFNAVKSSLYGRISDRALIGWIDGSALRAFAGMEANRTYKSSGMALVIINL